jgi:F-type H+-transporting ATPase subunit gamma
VANLKVIRKRIVSVKSTQKITRAMKMVAGARLNRAQQRITSLRPYAVRTGEVLSQVVRAAQQDEEAMADFEHPLLERRQEKTRLLLVITSDRGLCGSFNASINKRAEAAWREHEANGINVKFAIIGRKGRDYFRRRGAPIYHVFDSIWDRLDLEQARNVARKVLQPFINKEVDSIHLIYNEFKSAMTQRVVEEALFPLAASTTNGAAEGHADQGHGVSEFIFEPDQGALLERLVPMYVEISILRALYESMASELGARMTAMDAATKNASEMIGKLTLQYNRVRQAAITTEILEIIGGAEALNN